MTLRYLHTADLDRQPVLRDSMFRDRTTQFRDRLGWPVTVDDEGRERDQYDDLDPLYVVWESPDGKHGGSCRFLPTVGRTMVNEHFMHLTDDVRFRSHQMWECTRFCLAPGSSPRIASALMLAGGELMRAFNVEHFVGVFDNRMTRVYHMIGAVPKVLGTDGQISVGLWHYSPDQRETLLQRSRITSEQSERWFEESGVMA
jgi:acyl homoserine lactone synthase